MDAQQLEKRTSWFSRDVVGLALNRFLSDLGHEAGTAILPLFLATIGAPAAALGVIEAVSDGLSSFAKLFGGWLGDQVHRRKPWAALGYIVTGITTGMYALANAWPAVLVARAVGWAGRGLRSPLHDAMLTDVVPPEARGRAFGFDEAADTLGAVCGPLAALALVMALGRTMPRVDAYRWIFVLAAVPGVLAALSILTLVNEKPHERDGKLTFFSSMRALPPSFRRYLAGIFLFGIGDYANTLLILRATQVLTGRLGPEQAGSVAVALYTLHNVFYMAGAYPVGALADRFGKRWLLTGAYGLAALYNLLLIVEIPSVAVLALVFALAGTVYSSQQSLERAIAADLVPEQVRSTGFGVLATVNGIGDFVSSLVVGVLWSAFSPMAGFAYSLVLTLLGAVTMTVVLREYRS
ncbi:MAG TPA: MFS transporter [Aggregatilinea sp.]|uniref:MFS transporter n=1 Tax=Aggregatilinea sp. TaxID=2806333 RepID=UPI002B6140F2|nr:MFS transporter [Aggregatilinea sp.]HML20957.1 MFS transporter [Aggregatilinea sp.]